VCSTAFVNTHTHARTHAHTYIHMLMHARTHINRYAHKHTYTHKQTQEVCIPGTGGDASAFLRDATAYLNEQCFGSLAVGVWIHPETQQQHQVRVCVCVFFRKVRYVAFMNEPCFGSLAVGVWIHSEMQLQHHQVCVCVCVWGCVCVCLFRNGRCVAFVNEQRFGDSFGCCCPL
jgi:hypothetical protein